MIATNREVRRAYGALEYVLESLNDLRMTTGLKIRKMRRNMKGALEDLRDEEKKLVMQYAMQEDGRTYEFIKSADNEIIGYKAVKPEDQKELDERWLALMDAEVTIEVCPTLELDDFWVDGKERVGNMRFLEFLGPFFVEKEDAG